MLGAIVIGPVLMGAALCQDAPRVELERDIAADPFGADGTVEAVEFSADGARVAAGCSDGFVRVFEVATGALAWEARQFEGPRGGKRTEVECVSWSGDGRWLASAGNLDGIAIWDARNGRKVRTLPGNSDGLAFGPGPGPVGELLVAGNDPAAYRVADWSVLFRVEHPRSVNSVDFATDAGLVATGSSSRDNMVKLTDVRTGELVRVIATPESNKSVRFSPDGELLATANASAYSANLWRVGDGALVRSLPHRSESGPQDNSDGFENRTEPDYVEAVAWSPDGRWLLTGGTNDGIVRVFRRGTWECVREFQASAGAHAVEYIDVSPSGALIATCGEDGRVRLWHWGSGPAE